MQRATQGGIGLYKDQQWYQDDQTQILCRQDEQSTVWAAQIE